MVNYNGRNYHDNSLEATCIRGNMLRFLKETNVMCITHSTGTR